MPTGDSTILLPSSPLSQRASLRGWLSCSLQAIQSRDRIQLQYSQSLIEKDQYRKQVRGLEAERDELLTTVTSLEGAKAMLEAQLQRTQGGSSLKVSVGSSIVFWGWGAVDLGNLASWGKMCWLKAGLLRRALGQGWEPVGSEWGTSAGWECG